MTFLRDLPDVVRRIIEARGEGVYHAVNPGALSHREVLGAWRRHVDPLLPEPRWATLEDLEAAGLARAPRSHAALADARLASVGARMRDAHDALEEDLIMAGRKP